MDEARMRACVRGPQEIIDTLAARRGLVTPVPAYFPLGASFTAESIREAYRDAMDALADAARLAAEKPDAVEALKRVFEQLSAKAAAVR